MSGKRPFDLEGVHLGKEADSAFYVRFGVSTEERASLFAHGTWWVAPFAVTFDSRPDLVGVRLMPGRALADSPVVQVRGHEVETITSRPATYVPVNAFHVAKVSDESWEEARALPDKAWRELVSAHRALGGRDDLAGLRAVLDDGPLRRDLLARERAALCEGLCRLDPAPEHVAFRRYVDRAAGDMEAPTPLPDFGCWQAMAAAVAFIVDEEDEDFPETIEHRPRALEAAWELLRQPPGLDSFQYGVPMHLTAPRGNSQTGVPMRAAKLLVEHEDETPAEWRTHPMWPLARAIADAGPKYDALAHLAASRRCAQEQRFDAAFVALVGAEYWRYAFHRKSPLPRVAQAARLLAKEQGWTEIADEMGATISAAKQFLKRPASAKRRTGRTRR